MNSAAKVVSNILLILYYWLEGIVLAFIPRRFRFKDVTGETVLITGGGSGMGRLLARRLSALGARIVLWDINQAGNEETARQIRDADGEVFHYQCDISDRNAVYACAARVKDEVGKVTMLINNAGIVSGKRFLDIPDEKIVQTFDVNIMSHFWTCKAFLPDMIASNHGHIVSVASLAGLSGVCRLSDYCASKFAAVGFEECLRLELIVDGHSGVHSTVVCPFFVNTGMFNGVRSGAFTILEPEYAVNEIISAILTNQEVLILPKIFYPLLVMKAILPTPAYNHFYVSLGGDEGMNEFVGRTEHQEMNGEKVKAA